MITSRPSLSDRPGSPDRPERPERPDRSQVLRDVLQELGLAGRVRVGGASVPQTAPPEHEAFGPDFFGPDVWLHPLERSSVGRLIEIGGERSSGRTALAARLSSGATQRGELVGWVDTADALDPRSLARAGTDLERLLWVRPLWAQEAFRAAELLLKTGFAVVVVDLGGVEVRALQRLGSAVWSRLQRAASARGATVLVLGQDSAPALAGSFATLGLATTRRRALFDGGLFEGFEASARIVRWRAGPSGEVSRFRLLQRLSESARTERC